MKKTVLFYLSLFISQAISGQGYISLQPAIISANPTGLNNNSNNVSNPPFAPASGAGTRMMWIPTRSAFRAGSTFGSPGTNYWDAANIGLFSFAAGANTKASGSYSTSLGFYSVASGDNATSMGVNTLASGNNSTAIGTSTVASAYAATSMGVGTTASGQASTSMGNETSATGSYATSMGLFTAASGNSSTAIGSGTTASGAVSTSLGYGTTASGYVSTSTGFATEAIGDYSFSFGQNITAQASHSVVLGRNNIISGTATSWISSEPLFVIGNGVSSASRNNALTLLKNGQLGLGTTTVAANEIMQINGRLRLMRNTLPAGLWFNNSANGTAVTDGAFVGMNNETAGSESVGFWMNGAFQFVVDRTGNARVGGGLSVGGGETITKIKKLSYTHDVQSIPANTQSNEYMAVGDLASTDTYIVTPQGTIYPLIIANVRYVSSTYIEVNFYNPTNAALDIPSRAFNITVIR